MESGNERGMNRRALLQSSAAGMAVALTGLTGMMVQAADEKAPALKGNVNHAICRWCYDKVPLPELAKACARIGIKGMDLVDVKDWPILKENGLICTMSNSHGISPGLNRKENHEKCLKAIRESIEATAAAGYPNVICFPGNREGMDDETGLKNCTEALKQVVGLAEQKKVMLCMELLNSKRNHKDYMCDHTAWGVELCKRVGSPNFKLLYDIYHMQIMEGDVIDTIKENIQYIGHFHTGGVPGRNEIDDSQELYYPAIVKAILQTGYKGYVAQEFVPKRDPLKSMEEAIRICDV
ncbi:MAG TPA: sugar phosphate isomerase/epimerase family protein [Candidatus Sumerlaeota bacterium]|nr:sugar phosphate isomerase/epimerase family protein [Candidatus Sumerlaeota bacterium]